MMSRVSGDGAIVRGRTIVRRLQPGRGMAVVTLAAAVALGSQPAYGGGSRPVTPTESEPFVPDAPPTAPQGSTPIPGFPPGPTPIPGLQTPDEAEAQDLALVAAAHGWTVEEAAAHRRASDVIDEVARKVAAARPGAYVGAAVPAEPGDPSTLYIKGPADRFVRDLVAKAGVAITIVDNQPFSLDELEQRKLVVHRALEARGFKNISTGYDVTRRGEIDTAVTREPGLPAEPAVLVKELPSEVRGQVRLTVSDEPVATDQHAYGGMWVRNAAGTNLCTSGWSVYAVATGTTGVTTAGHCTGIAQIVEPGVGIWALTHQQEHRGQWGDVEWLTSTHIEPTQFFATATQVRRVHQLEAQGDIRVGETVCLYGRASNQQDCTRRVAEVSMSCTAGGVTNNRLVRMDGTAGTGGDSGAPWYVGNRAYGSHKGQCGGAVFSVADLYDEALGVRVRLSQRLSTRVALNDDDRLVSTDGRFTAIMQSDGNFVIYQSGGVGAIWATGTNGNNGARIVMQADGNLVVYRSNGSAAWNTGTFGSGHYLLMQNDGNLVMYRESGGAVWASGTCCR